MTLATAPTDVQERPRTGVMSVLANRYRTIVDLVIVVGAALVFRLAAVGFGLPDMLHPDEPGITNVGADMAANSTWDPHYFSYPSVLYDVIALADRVQRLLVGHMLLPSSYTSEGMGINRTSDPGMILALRLITVTLSVGICVVAYAAIRRITGRRWVAVGCGLLAATSPLLITNGVFITPDTYSAFFMATTLAASLAVLRRGTRLDYILAGVAVGFTAGSKYDIAAGLPILLAYVVREGRDAWRPRALRSLVLAAAVAAVVFVITTPSALFATNALVAGLKVELTHYSTGHPGEQGGSFGYYLSTIWHDQPVLLPGSVVAVLAAWFGRFRKEVIVIGAFAIANFGLIASETVRFDRDALPLLPALVLLTGFAVAWLTEVVAGRWPAVPRPGRLALVTGAVAVALIPAVIGAVGIPQTLDEAPRTEAAAWLDAHVAQGSTVVNENYGPWLDESRYKVTGVSYVVAVTLPSDPDAIILTEEGSGRFMDDAKAYPSETAAYKAILSRYCVAVKYTNGPWVEVLTPCG